MSKQDIDYPWFNDEYSGKTILIIFNIVFLDEIAQKIELQQ